MTVDLGTLTDEYEKEITIHTTATGKDGEKSIVAGKEVTIVDTVTLEGLEKGTKYQLKGWQMLKEENIELLIDGQRVENSYTFTADDEEMKIEMEYTFNASSLGGQNLVTFTFDASELGGKELVTFEELYDLSNPDEPTKVTEHKDIEDDGQTVTITEVPETPEEPTPEQSTTQDTPSKTTDAPKTGDNTNIALFLGLLALSGAGVTGTYFFKRRRS